MGIGGVGINFKDFSSFSSGGHLVYQRGTILAILIGSRLGNIPLKFESHLRKGLRRDSIKSKLFRFFYF